MSKRLVDLHPRWVSCGGPDVTDSEGNPVAERRGVGIMLDCPCGCVDDLYVPFANPIDGKPNLDADRRGWQRSGETFETLTLTPSIHRIGESCGWHGWITNGEAKSV